MFWECQNEVGRGYVLVQDNNSYQVELQGGCSNGMDYRMPTASQARIALKRDDLSLTVAVPKRLPLR